MAKDLIKKEQIDIVNHTADVVKETRVGDLMKSQNSKSYIERGKFVSYSKNDKQRIQFSETGPFQEITISRMDDNATQEERNKGIKDLYKQGKTQKEIGEISGMSQSRVSQILHKK